MNTAKSIDLKNSFKEKCEKINKKLKDENLFINLFQLAFRSDEKEKEQNDCDINFVYTYIDRNTGKRKIQNFLQKTKNTK